MKELRTIIFDEKEAAGALIELCRRANRPTPRGTLKGFVIDESEEDVTGTLTVVDDHGVEHDMAFSQQEIAAALVNFCLYRHIPLPKKAQKMITAVEGQIVLALEIGHSHELRAAIRAVAAHQQR